MRARLAVMLATAAIPVAALSGGGAAAGRSPAAIVPPIENRGGILYVTVGCEGAPNTAVCKGGVAFVDLDPVPTRFAIAPGQRKEVQVFIPGPLHAAVRKWSSIKATLTQTVDGAAVEKTATYRLVQTEESSGGGPGAGAGSGPSRDAIEIGPGPATRYEAVHDPRGDARSSFQLPQLFDIVLATAKRRGDAVVLTVVSTAGITLHDSQGNPVAPCVEIPWPFSGRYPMFLFGNGQLSGYTQHVWPKMKTTIHGGTISWTVPRTVLAKKGFTKGFLWRATGGCDTHHLADVAPNHGFETFRWVKVP